MVNKNLIIAVLLLLTISLSIFTFYKVEVKKNPDRVKVYFTTDFQTGAVVINSDPYLCGYNDGICPNDYSPDKKVCDQPDPDC